MPAPVDKVTRLLRLAALLEDSTRHLSAEEIRERVEGYAEGESGRRTFERDKDDLLAMGVPLEYAEESYGSDAGYTINYAHTTVADPRFTAPELAALRFAATMFDMRDSGEVADAAAGLRKLGGLGPTADGPATADLVLDGNLGTLFDAILADSPVVFTHAGRTRRTIPRQVVNRSGNWYLRCLDLDVHAQRTFRLDRIEGRVLPLPPGEADDDLAEARASIESARDAGAPAVGEEGLAFRPWEFGTGEAEEVLVRLDGVAAALARLEHPDLEVRSTTDAGGTVLALRVRSAEGLWNWVLPFLDRAEVVGPPEWRRRAVEVIAELADGAGS